MKSGTVAFVLACLACCLPLLLGIVGVTTGATGAAAIWLGRNQALIIAVVGLGYLAYTAVRHIRARAASTERVGLSRITAR